MPTSAPLLDSLGRVHTSLRISVTDRCNIRCFYCMPETVRFLPREEILSFEEIERFAAKIGIAPGIVVGRLQHDGLMSWKFNNSLKKTLKL